MKILLDTSVVVAALLPGHESHQAAVPWLSRARSGRVPVHLLRPQPGGTLRGAYQDSRLSANFAGNGRKLIRENIVSAATLVAIHADEYLAVLEEMIEKGLTGGAVYDAVIAAAAKRAEVDLLVTLNAGHFQRIWPAGAGRIVSPTAVPVP